jgi:hypothetical protein bacD2_14083
MMKRFLLFTYCLLFAASQMIAQLSMPSFFSDHMVLQREKPIRIWGTAHSGEKISVTLGDIKKSIRVDKNGKWLVSLPPMQAGGPYTLTVKSPEQSLSFSDILIGEVWICSGQSNMEFRLRSANHAIEEIATANYPQIRSFNVIQEMRHTPKNNLKGKWEVCSPTSASDFSAVGYFFARELYQKLNIPIGFINSSWGGTDIETWISMEVMDHFPKYEKLLSRMRSPEFEEYIKRSDKVKTEFEQAILNEPGETEKWYSEDTSTENWKKHAVPSLWSNEELSVIDGVVWFTYQFSIPANCLNQDAELSLGTIDDDDITWVNGYEVGRTVGYDLKRLYKIPAKILKEQNTITIKISDYRGGGGLYGTKDEVYLKINNRIFPLCDDWKYKVAVSNAQYDYVEYGPNSFPSLLFNAMINPLIGLGMKGVIWYQGENNAGRANEYIDLFPALIKDWRNRWDCEFPFYWVQLANFMAPARQPSESHWANLRDAQSKTLALPYTGQAVIIDIGEEKNIHPRNKQDVGKRLALHALRNDYGYDSIVCTGPVFKSVKRIGNTLEVTFGSCAGELIAHNKYGYLSGFAIAGTDGKYQWAQAKIENNKVIVWNTEIQQPVSVRYAWGDNPDDANLYNSVNLPASPFEGHTSQ